MAVKVSASAPSNIALIKYMGKTASGGGNLPANPSLSYTLDHLKSHVELEEADEDSWAPLKGYPEIKLSDAGRRKYLSHFHKLKEKWKIQGHYAIRSANDFPSDCGLASSASSFAALTKATYELGRKLNPELSLEPEQLSAVSRLGSGSSCRSFFSPWALWKNEGAQAMDLPLRLQHAVLLIESGIKNVSSSDAHLRVGQSLLFHRRAERAQSRLQGLLQALRAGDWSQAFELCWSEFWDMHALFETSEPSFGYMTGGSLRALGRLREVWRQTGDGPLVTMDAGANVHLLLRDDQIEAAEGWTAGFESRTSWRSKR
jgi:diphosphomevalonate decarboxylase